MISTFASNQAVNYSKSDVVLLFIHLSARYLYLWSVCSPSHTVLCTAIPRCLGCENEAAPKKREFNFTAPEMILIQ